MISDAGDCDWLQESLCVLRRSRNLVLKDTKTDDAKKRNITWCGDVKELDSRYSNPGVRVDAVICFHVTANQRKMRRLRDACICIELPAGSI